MSSEALTAVPTAEGAEDFVHRKEQQLLRGRLGAAQRHEARVFALQIVRDPLYRARLLVAAQAGRLTPQIEQMLWHYAFGKPPDRLELGRIGDTEKLELLSREELAARARALAEALLKPALLAAEQSAEQAAAQQTDREIEDREVRREAQALTGLTPRQIGELLEAKGLLEEPE